MLSNPRFKVIAVFSVAFIFFGYHLGVIPHLYFDELHYITSANQWLHMVPIGNFEHPLIGKLIMALFIQIFGDNFFGWRLGSVIFGSLGLVYIYKLAQVYFKKDSLSVFSVTGLALFNFCFFVQSRIAMIDIYMLSFFLMAWYYQIVFQEEKQKKDLYLAGIFWGLGIATKWSILLFFIPAVFVLCFRKLGFKLLLVFLGICLGVYYISFVPYLFVKTEAKLEWYQIFFEMPFRMLELQKSVGGFHIYESKWYTWPLMIRPIWYEFKSLDQLGSFQGVQMIGNPVVVYMGLLSTLALFFGWRKNQDRKIKELVFVFLISYFLWALIPRKMSYFYYFVPYIGLYSFIIPAAFKTYFQDRYYKWLLSFLVLSSMILFLYFYPILSGIVTDSIERPKWFWLKGWI